MKTKVPFKKFSDSKKLIAVMVAAIIMPELLAQSVSRHPTEKSPKSSITETLNDTIYIYGDEAPEYPGGPKALLDFIYKNLQYPKEAKENNIEGRVICRFEINKEGSAGKIEILSSIDPSLNTEAIRVLKLIKGWKPATKEGKPISVWYSVPIMFQPK